MTIVCMTCGDIGKTRELVFCFHCLDCAVHTYCEDLGDREETPCFLCDECASADESYDEMLLETSWDRRERLIEFYGDDNDESKISDKKRGNAAAGGRGESGLESEMNPTKKRKKLCEEETANFTYSFSLEDFGDKPPEPKICSVWTGSFKLCKSSIVTRISGFSAHVSTKAPAEIYETVSFEEPIEFQMVPMASALPEIFGASGPKCSDIEIYFFPSLMKNRQPYKNLIVEMCNGNFVLRARLGNAELLVLTSSDLPGSYRAFQDSLFLWGFFRQLQPLYLNDNH